MIMSRSNNTTFYTYTPDRQIIENVEEENAQELSRKLSSEKVYSSMKPDTSLVDSLATSANTVQTSAKVKTDEKRSRTLLNSTMTAKDPSVLDRLSVVETPNYESLSDHTFLKQDGYFTKLLVEEDKKPVLEKVEELNFDEDKITTYDEMFENFNKSDNGSDWNISCGDPFDIKDNGFPQPLPTSDIGSIFNKYGSGYVGDHPPETQQLPELDSHVEEKVLNKDLIKLVHEEEKMA